MWRSITRATAAGAESPRSGRAVQTITHAIRHAAIFGAVESLATGGGMVISAPHDPVPLLRQLRAKHGETYSTEYLEQGPERWRIEIRHAG